MAIKIDSFCDCGPGSVKKTAASKIFETAKDLFYKRGVRDVGVDEIVAGAGVTKPSLYRAYRSKDDLVAACLQESADDGRAAVDAAVNAAGPCPRDKLRAIVAHFAEKIGCVEFRGCLISNVAVELPEPDHPGRIILRSCKTDLRGLMVDICRDLHVDDPDALANGLMLVIEGAMASHHIFGSQGPALALTPTCETLIRAHLPDGFPLGVPPPGSVRTAPSQ
jgi:AcrR family transcriptional regulator